MQARTMLAAVVASIACALLGAQVWLLTADKTGGAPAFVASC